MSVSGQMKTLGSWGRFHLGYAERRVFAKPGLYLWTGERNRRILPLPRRRR